MIGIGQLTSTLDLIASTNTTSASLDDIIVENKEGITVKGKTLEEFRLKYVLGKDDGAGRFKTTAHMQSFVVDRVQQGASSKNSETVRAMIQRFPRMVPDFDDSINTIFCDQEVAPSMFSGFFQSLKSNKTEDRSWCLPLLAIGHLIKNICTLMLQTYSVWFEPLMKVNGITIGSPEHSRLIKGRNIRNATKMVTNCITTLRMAMAKEYLDHRGDTILLESQLTPKDVLLDLLGDREGNKQTSLVEVILCRPQPLRISEMALEVAR